MTLGKIKCQRVKRPKTEERRCLELDEAKLGFYFYEETRFGCVAKEEGMVVNTSSGENQTGSKRILWRIFYYNQIIIL